MVSFDLAGVCYYRIKNFSADWISFVAAIESFDITDPDNDNSNNNRNDGNGNSDDGDNGNLPSFEDVNINDGTETVNENPDDDNSSYDDNSDDLSSLEDPRDDSTLSLEVDEVVESIDHLELEQILARHEAIEVVASADIEIFARHAAIEVSVSDNRLIIDSGFVDSSPGNNDDSTLVDDIRSPTGVVEASVYFSTEDT